jgi:hypothetical protein
MRIRSNERRLLNEVVRFVIISHQSRVRRAPGIETNEETERRNVPHNLILGSCILPPQVLSMTALTVLHPGRAGT